MEARPQLGVPTRHLSSKIDPQIYHLPNWDRLDDRQKLDAIAKIIEQYGRDPRVAQKAVEILKANGVKPREYVKQAEALLKWTQTQIFYVNEPKERLQSPSERKDDSIRPRISGLSEGCYLQPYILYGGKSALYPYSVVLLRTDLKCSPGLGCGERS